MKFSKERLKLQVEVDVVNEMDIYTKVKKLGANMWKQVAHVLKPFLDFMDCFKLC